MEGRRKNEKKKNKINIEKEEVGFLKLELGVWSFFLIIIINEVCFLVG